LIIITQKPPPARVLSQRRIGRPMLIRTAAHDAGRRPHDVAVVDSSSADSIRWIAHRPMRRRMFLVFG